MPVRLEKHKYSLPLLDRSHQTKTIDFGSNGIAVSLSTTGRIITIAAGHPTQGQVLVAPWPQFPAERHHDQPYVREYRALPMESHNDPAAGLGIRLSQANEEFTPSSWSYINGSWPRSVSIQGTCQITTTYTVQGRDVIHHANLSNRSSAEIAIRLDLSGCVSLHRAAYTQLTPQGDCTIPPVENALSALDGCINISNSHLPSSLQVRLCVDGVPVQLDVSPLTSPEPVSFSHSRMLRLPPFGQSNVTVLYSIASSPKQIIASLQQTISPMPPTLVSLINPDRLSDHLGEGERGRSLSYIVLRNVDYLLSCCTVPVGDSLCIITDHQCLPLGWNRDNYWQLDMLGAVYDRADDIAQEGQAETIRESILKTMRGHLQWVYRTAQRPDGYWARSFFTGGAPKDTVFQLDQQCYPLLELAEYADRFRRPEDVAFVSDLAGDVDAILGRLQDKRWTGSSQRQLWLFKTDETPADDEVAHPYHFSSHILLWHTLKALTRLQAITGDSIRSNVAEWAENVHRDTLNHFRTVHPTIGPIFAYLTSTTGQYQFYHDANDLPSALAPRWGFCEPDDVAWVNTIRFAFSDDNNDGWYPGGEYGGLGSVHTRDPWPLGDGQQLSLIAMGGKSRQELNRCLDKIIREVQWDGMFSEAVDRHSGVVTSKNWFSWPGSFISSTLLYHAPSLF